MTTQHSVDEDRSTQLFSRLPEIKSQLEQANTGFAANAAYLKIGCNQSGFPATIAFAVGI
jgi:hypothetical protein